MIFKKLKNCIDKNYRYIFACLEEKDSEGKDVIAIYSLFFNDKLWVTPETIGKEGIRKFMSDLKVINKQRIAEWACTKHSNVVQGWNERYLQASKKHDAKEMVDSEFKLEQQKMFQQTGLKMVIIHSIMD